MKKKLTPSRIAVAVAAGLSAQTALAQTPVVPPASGTLGQESTPMIKLNNNEYAGQGFFDKPAAVPAPAKKVEKIERVAPKAEEKAAKVLTPPPAPTPVAPPKATKVVEEKKPMKLPEPAPAILMAPAPAPVASAPIKDPMLPLDIVGSRDAKENTNGGLTPPLAKKKTASGPVARANANKLQRPETLLAQDEGALLQTPALRAKPVKASAKAPKKKPPVLRAEVPRLAPEVAPDPLLKLMAGQEAVPMVVKELPSTTPSVAPVLYAAQPSTPIIVTEVVRIDSISLNAPNTVEPETQPLPRLPEPEPVASADTTPAPLTLALQNVASRTNVAAPAVAAVPSAVLPPPALSPNRLEPLAINEPAHPTPASIAQPPLEAIPVAMAVMTESQLPSSGASAPVPASQKKEKAVDVPMAVGSMDDLLASLDAPSVDAIRSASTLLPKNAPVVQPAAAVVPIAVAQAEKEPTKIVAQLPKDKATNTVHTVASPVAVPAPVSAASNPSKAAQPMQQTSTVAAAETMQQSAQQHRDERIEQLLAELKRLQSSPIPVQMVQPPVEVVPPHRIDVPKINPAATIQLPQDAKTAVSPPAPEPIRMVTEQAPKVPVNVPQTVAIHAPRLMTPATPAPVLEPRAHRVANPKFAGLSEKGDFIAFMPGSSRVSEETVESLRTMVGVFKQHGIRKIVLTGTALRDEDSEDMESSDFAQQRAKNLRAAFQRVGFKGVIVLDDPKRARPGTTPRVGLVALR